MADGKPSTSTAVEVDAFSALEKSINDREVSKTRATRLQELEEAASSRSSDPYTLNATLRSTFRKGRRERKEVAQKDDDLRNRIGWSTGMPLVSDVESKEEEMERRRLYAEARDRRAGIGGFVRKTTSSTSASGKARSKAEATASLAARLRANTKQRQDPFQV
jgi:hypothetical protein